MRTFTTPRTAPAILGLIAAVAFAALLALASQNAHAASVASWSSRVAADQQQITRLADDIEQASVEIARDEAGLQRSGAVVSQRLSAIYESGGADPMDHVGHMVASGMTVSQATDAADVIRTVAQQDRHVLEQYRKVARRLPRLRSQLAHDRRDLSTARRHLTRDQHGLAAAQRAAAAAQAAAIAAAARLAAMPDSPLANPAVSPETIAVVTAQRDAVDSGSANAAASASAGGSSMQGVASTYSNALAGKPTSSGEPYNPGAMTAASTTLPLGSWVTVTGPGGSALVRINDRGPFVGGRLIDLSAAAAAAVGLPGIGNVTISVH